MNELRLTLPLPPSANKIHTVDRSGHIIHSKVARSWKKAAALEARRQAKAQQWTVPEPGWVRLTFFATFPDRRVRDVTNLHKITCDALVGVCYQDDRWALAHDEPPVYEKGTARLELVVTCE